MQFATETDIAYGVEQPRPRRGRLDTERGDFDVGFASTIAELDSLAPEWRMLERLSNPAAVFQAFAHIRIWARHFTEKRRGAEFLAVTVRKRGRAILILPLVISGPPHVRIARIAGDPVAQYQDLLLDPAEADRAAFEAALAPLLAVGVGAIVLRRVREDSHLLRLAGSSLRPPTSRTVAPYADLRAFPDFAAFLQSLSKKMRQGLRNRRNHLEAAAPYRFETFRGGEAARVAVADAIDLKRKWLVQHGSLSSAFVDPATRQCLLDLAASTDTGAVVTRLIVDGEPAAVRFGFEHSGTHFAYMSAYDGRFASISPGKLLMEYTISGFRERGFERVDMLPPAGRHKSDWCRSEIGVADYTLPLTRTGRAYAEIYQERVRPALKTAWSHMPETLRSLAAALFISI